MRFIYRGVRYEATPATLATQEEAVCGQYRGAAWHCRKLTETPAPQPMHQLKYRGVPYTTGGTLDRTIKQDQTTLVPQLTPVRSQAKRLSRTPTLSNRVRAQVNRLHRSNIQHNIEHRIEVAKAKHDNALVALLEREFEEALCRQS